MGANARLSLVAGMQRTRDNTESSGGIHFLHRARIDEVQIATWGCSDPVDTVEGSAHAAPYVAVRIDLSFSRAVCDTILAYRFNTICPYRYLKRIMSPRSRKVSDEEVFAATHRAMARLGPGELTLAEIASEAGVTAGALSQRFGSKRRLLLALSEAAANSAGVFIRKFGKSHRSPLAAVRAYAECLAHLAASPAALARNLAYLQIDLSDPDFRSHLAVQARETRKGLHMLLDEAIAARELKRSTDVDRLTRTIEVALNGSLITWAFYHDDGTPARWLRGNVDAVLAPHIVNRRKPVVSKLGSRG